MSLSRIGKWPTDPVEARKSGELFVIGRDDVLRTIHGEEHPIPINLFISTDFGHLAEIAIPCGGYGPRASDSLAHGSDSLLYVLDGPVTVFTTKDRGTFQVENDEAMFLPAKTEYILLNYTGRMAKVLLAAGPKL
jgi:gentisate 1,2-dioxygenase